MIRVTRSPVHGHPAIPAAEVTATGWNRRAAAILARSSFGLIAVWIVATMVAKRAGWTRLWQILDLPFWFVCHRLPERVLSVLGTPMPLCSRCAGIWLGLSVSAALARPDLPRRTLRITVGFGAAFMIAELVTQDLGLHPVFHPTRLLSGLLIAIPLGGAIGSVIARELGQRNSQDVRVADSE